MIETAITLFAILIVIGVGILCLTLVFLHVIEFIHRMIDNRRLKKIFDRISDQNHKK